MRSVTGPLARAALVDAVAPGVVVGAGAGTSDAQAARSVAEASASAASRTGRRRVVLVVLCNVVPPVVLGGVPSSVTAGRVDDVVRCPDFLHRC